MLYTVVHALIFQRNEHITWTVSTQTHKHTYTDAKTHAYIYKSSTSFAITFAVAVVMYIYCYFSISCYSYNNNRVHIPTAAGSRHQASFNIQWTEGSRQQVIDIGTRLFASNRLIMSAESAKSL